MNIRAKTCYILARLRLHDPDCEHCNTQQVCGNEIIKRLRELNSQSAELEQERDDKNSAA